MGHMVMQLEEHCTTSQVAGSVPSGVIGIFVDIILQATL